MNTEILSISLAIALGFAGLSIVFAAILRAMISSNPAAAEALLTKGSLLGGAASSVRTLNAIYLWPWKALPRQIQLNRLQHFFFQAARVSASLAAVAVLAGAVSALVAGWA